MSEDERERFPRVVEARARRKRRAREHRPEVWFGLGMFGLVGWSVAIPTLVGIAVGAWFDTRSGGDRVSWTLTGMAVGLTVGCLLAWFWVRQETGRGSRAAPPHEGDRTAGTGPADRDTSSTRTEGTEER